MRSLRSFFVQPVKWALARTGRDIVSRDKYGYDPFLDIVRLSETWRYPIDVFFDVGANDGATIRHAQSRLGNCRIFAFEPHPQTFSNLKNNFRGVENVELVNLAVGSEIATKTMFEYDMSVLNSLLPNAQFAVRFDKKAREIKVDCTTLDNFCSDRDIHQIDVLKIDTEGFDFEVLKGARSMLSRRAIKFVYFEFNDISPRGDASGGALEPIDKFIRPLGYRFIASYNDYVLPEGELFLVSNALYAMPPTALTQQAILD